MSIIETLIKRLTKEEFSILCEEWDDGSFDDQMNSIGLPFDKSNFPGKYTLDKEAIGEDDA